MCGRYYIPDEDSAEELRVIIEEVNRKSVENPVKTGEIAPTDTAPVIANSRSLEPTPFAMKWGYTLPNGKLVFNTRSETAVSKPMFKEGMTQRRCLVPAGHYYEWEKRGREKIKYSIGRNERGIIFMAGIYRLENGKPVFSVLTREPAAQIAFIHDRMPVILPVEATKDWLNTRYAPEDVLKAAWLDVSFEPEHG